MSKVVIVGAGLGGLACGIKLVSSGIDVTIIEKNGHPGGKMMPITLGDYEFDYGPNTITMPHVFKRVIEETGENPDDYFQFKKIEHHTRNWFEDGTVFDQITNRDKMVTELKKHDSFAAKQYDTYLMETEKLYQHAEESFLYRTFQNMTDYLSPKLAAALMKVRPLETMDHFHRRFFKNENILKAFNRYATYIGSSPYMTPATFSLIGHLEMADGVYYTKGGNPNIAMGFAKLFEKLGGKLLLTTEVKEVDVQHKKVTGVKLSNGDTIKADIVVINGDLITSTKHLLKEESRPSMPNTKLDSYEPSISAFVILAGVKEKFDSFIHHQVFFSDDYKKEFHEIFHEKKLPTDPTVYICNSSYSDPIRAKGSNLFILVNAPAISDKTLDYEAYKHVVYEKVARFGFTINPEVEKVFTPEHLRSNFYAYRGALYGVASHQKKDAFLRPMNTSKDIDGLFYTGGTTHPGGGSPMVTISGMNVGEAVLQRIRGK